MLRLVCLLICVIQLFQLSVAAGNQFLFRGTVQAFGSADLVKLEFAYTEDLIIMIQSTGMQHHMSGKRVME